MRVLRTVGSWVRELSRPGESEIGPRALRWLTSLGLSSVIIVTNVIGAVIVVALLSLKVIPLPPLDHRTGAIRLDNAVVAAVYVLIAVPVGWLFGNRIVWGSGGWLTEERAPSAAETRALLYAPRRLFGMQLVLWLAAALLFSLFNVHFSAKLAVRVAIVVSLTGFATGACAYLVAERILRSVTARALTHGLPANLGVPGVVVRTLLAWGLGTIVPIGGLTSIGVLALINDGTTNRENLGVSIIVLCGTGILVGLLAVVLAVRTTAEPISSVRRGLSRVKRGDFDARIPVYDASEVGQLQIGFNEMAEGLAERERIRSAFGTYVDPDVAEKIIDSGTSLTGEEVDVTCMFIDVRGFTPFAEQTPAEAVVARLNMLFEAAVPIIHDQHGRIDKFVGDGLLAVFGAPRRLENHAEAALAAARQIAAAVDGLTGFDLSIGIGLNSGPVVAGNVGGGGRFEFSVIGDSVNVAARVEAATRQTGDTILLAETTLSRLEDRVDATEREGISLKGKHDPVRVYAVAAVSADTGAAVPASASETRGQSGAGEARASANEGEPETPASSAISRPVRPRR